MESLSKSIFSFWKQRFIIFSRTTDLLEPHSRYRTQHSIQSTFLLWISDETVELSLSQNNNNNQWTRNETKINQRRFVLFELPDGKEVLCYLCWEYNELFLSKVLLFMEKEVYVEISGRVQV